MLVEGQIEGLLVEVPDPEGPLGAKGLGEHFLVPTAPAILNAIRLATGANITRLPALPHRLLEAIRRIRPRAINPLRCLCPVMCYIAPGQTGTGDRHANGNGRIVRTDPVVMLSNALGTGQRLVPFAFRDWDGDPLREDTVVTGIGAGTTDPDYKPAPFIVSSRVDGADMVTVVIEAIFSYCCVKVKIDTDRYFGPESAPLRSKGKVIGHVTTAEYRSPKLSIGGVHHFTGSSKAQGREARAAMLALCNAEAVELTIDSGATVTVQAGRAPVVEGVTERRMRVGCGSATIGMFAVQWFGLVDEVVVVDDHFTGGVSGHQAGKIQGWQPTGIKINGHRSTPGRYFQMSEPGLGWGGTRLNDPLEILGPWNAGKGARPGLTLLMVATTGEDHAFFVLDQALTPQKLPIPPGLKSTADFIAENCEPSLCTVLFMAGAGGPCALASRGIRSG